MNGRTQLDEARRWTKFPATLLFSTCLLWLVVVVPRAAQDWDSYVAQPSETFVGALAVILQLVVVPLTCPLAAIGMLFLQRSALYLGLVLPFIPLGAVSVDKAARISAKFGQYRELGDVASFGDGVLDGLMLLGFWLIAVVHVMYIRKALSELAIHDQWQSRPVQVASSGRAATPPMQAAVTASQATVEEDDTCFLLPETQSGERDD